MGVFTFNPHETQQMESIFIALSEEQVSVRLAVNLTR